MALALHSGLWRQLLRGWCLVALTALPLQAFRGILEGDMEVDLYINGVYTRQDTTNPVLPLNNLRKFDASLSAAFTMSQNDPFEVGDTIALHVRTTHPLLVTVKNADHSFTLYPGFGSVIAAFEDGTLTNEKWRCTIEKEDKWQWKKFVDWHWPFAVAQATSCCPWRDKQHKWNKLHAKWIGPQNASVAREFFCRYIIPATQTVIDGSITNAHKVHMPKINITRLSSANSIGSVQFSVSKPATIYCMMLNAKYELRPPSPLEVESVGATVKITGWLDVTVGNYRHHYSHPALAWYTFANVEGCQAKCSQHTAANGPCGAITFFTSGQDPTTNANCKLMHHEVSMHRDFILMSVSFANERVQHMVLQPFPVVDSVNVAGVFFPGSVYSAYCSARDIVTQKHSTWEAVKGTKMTTRFPGCFDCGATTLPYVQMMGGFASTDAITALVWSSQAGRVFCAAKALAAFNTPFSLTPVEIKATSIDVSKHFSLIAQAGQTAQVTVTGLAPNTLHELACMGESDSAAESDLKNLQDTRRQWSTEATVVPIWEMTIAWKVLAGEFPTASLTVGARMLTIGYLWCKDYLTSETETDGVPNMAKLQTEGYRMKVENSKQPAGGVFPDLQHNLTYQAFCTGRYDDFTNETSVPGSGLAPDYPAATVVRYSSGDGEVFLTMQIERGPATTYCYPYRWPRRPFSVRPPVPMPMPLRDSPFKQDTMTEKVGYFDMTLTGLASGSWYDLYCFAEEWAEPAPPGAVEPLRKGMSLAAIANTRITIKTSGPKYRDLGWTCTAGHPCAISNLEGDGLATADKIIVQSEQCPGLCQCNGNEDEDRKGAVCSAVSHDRNIRAPDPMFNGIEAVDRADPLGPWCHVKRGTCRDEKVSPHFPSLYLSYAACIFQNSTVGVPGAEPPGFPDLGVATMTSAAADAYRFGSGPLLAGGKPYHLCWCNGTSALCQAVSDFPMRIGILHLTGPSAEQQTTTMTCIAGQPCTLRFYKGHGLANGNRLVVMPYSNLGCKWVRQNSGDPLSLPGIPNHAVSQPATVGGTTFSWGPETVSASGGLYLLCWCGSSWGAHHWLRPDCPVPRPEKGDHYLAHGGYLSLIGPTFGSLRVCNIGVECILENIPGNGLEGGDKVSILKECGKSTPPPDDWALGGSGSSGMPADWLPGGWLSYGPVLAKGVLESSGGPLRSSAQVSRGAWGMPNHGISLPNPRKGHFSWGGPSQNEPGDYALCWCAARAECNKPEHFKVLISAIRFLGPTVYPSASQARICVRNRQCELLNHTGVWPSAGGQLFIASAGCGSVAALGAPRNGISFTSGTGNDFKWGQDPLASPAGKYRLCWCFQGFACTKPEDFASFAGILQVKSPFGPLRQFWCAIGKRCRIDNIAGEGSNSGDKVMVMTVCGDGLGSQDFEERGLSQETGDDGTWFMLPKAIAAGKFRACWCAGETLCSDGKDFDHDLGPLLVGGPDASAVYQCYEWEPCALHGVLGTDLSDGDRILVVDPSINCSEPNITTVNLAGWPQDGMTTYGVQVGTVFSWGSGQVRVPPGVYTLCWCGVRTAPGGVCNQSAPFDMPAGQIKVGTSKEFMFVTRVKDPEERSMEGLYALLLLAPLALVACGLGFLGWKRVTPSNNRYFREAPTPFPKTKAWAGGEQDRLRLEHSVKQVSSQREMARGTLNDVQDDHLLAIDMPDFTGRTKVSVEVLAEEAMKKSLEALREGSKAIEDEEPTEKVRFSRQNSPTNIADSPSLLPIPEIEDTRKFLPVPSSARGNSRKQQANNFLQRVKDLPFMGSIFGSKSQGPTDEEKLAIRDLSRRNSLQAIRVLQQETSGIGPASPTACWQDEWDKEDGPMPPGMEFSFNDNERRKAVMLKILDL